jgi:hypothetical protein
MDEGMADTAYPACAAQLMEALAVLDKRTPAEEQVTPLDELRARRAARRAQRFGT